MKRVAAIVAVGAIWLVTIGAVLQTTPADAAQHDFHYMDTFSSGKYNGNDGPDSFTESWSEALDWGGRNHGAVTVASGGACPDDRCVRISGDGLTFWGTGLMRTADTLDAASVTVKFKYALDVNRATTGTLEVVTFGKGAWTVVDVISLENPEDDWVHTMTYDATAAADVAFAIGFFAHGEWDADIYIDDVEVFGDWDEPPPSTTVPSTTTTITLPPTTTTTTTTRPPTTTTTTTTGPPTPSTTFAPPPTTTSTVAPTTTAGPVTTTTAPPTTIVALPPAGLPPSTSPPSQLPLIDDERFTQRNELIRLALDDHLMALPLPEEDVVAPGPVTQIMASITTTAVTVRSHFLSTMALGLLIAVAAVWGLGKREATA